MTTFDTTCKAIVDNLVRHQALQRARLDLNTHIQTWKDREWHTTSSTAHEDIRMCTLMLRTPLVWSLLEWLVHISQEARMTLYFPTDLVLSKGLCTTITHESTLSVMLVPSPTSS